MNEEINQDTNCIIKAFENNPIAIILEQISDKKVHCFKASDIAKALNIINIRTSIMNFDEDEVVIRTTYDTIKRMQQTLFLTSQGVYRVLYNSKKPEAKKFRKWVGNILDDIIFNESRELRIQLENHKLELEHEKKVNKQDKQEILLKSYSKKSVVYLILISDILYKYGYTDDIQKRLLSHRRDYGKDCELIYCIESKNNRLLESQLKEITHIYKKEMTIKDIVRTELIETNDINYIKEKLVTLNNKICEDKELLLCKKRILELENERYKIDNLENYNQLLILQNENITKTTLNLELQIKLKQLQLQLQLNSTTSNTATSIDDDIITTTPDNIASDIIFIDDNIIMTQIPELNELQINQLNHINDKKEKSKLSDKLYREKNAKIIKETRELDENRIKKRAADKIYRENNKEKIKLGKKEYSKKESGKETVKNYYNNNKDEINRKRRECSQSKKELNKNNV